MAATPLLGVATPASAAQRSGLRWKSGCSLQDCDTWASFRRRPIDSTTLWGNQNSWDEVATLGGGFPRAARTNALLSLAVVPLPKTASSYKNPGIYRRVANGEFDRYYVAFAQKLAAAGASGSIVRIGWETNGNFSWSALPDPTGFKAGFARIAGIVRRYNRGVRIEWSNQRGNADGTNVLNTYPGDGVVDIIGVNYYDGFPAMNNEATWNAAHNEMNKRGGPRGLNTWLAFAKSRRKPLGISEWGIRRGAAPGCTDNPLFIRKMFEFFSANASSIAYENYFSEKREHTLNPTNINPKASAEYRRLWG